MHCTLRAYGASFTVYFSVRRRCTGHLPDLHVRAGGPPVPDPHRRLLHQPHPLVRPLSHRLHGGPQRKLEEPAVHVLVRPYDRSRHLHPDIRYVASVAPHLTPYLGVALSIHSSIHLCTMLEYGSLKPSQREGGGDLRSNLHLVEKVRVLFITVSRCGPRWLIR